MDILELELLTGNLAETEKFYHGVLDLKIFQKSDSRISFLAGKSLIIFKKVENLNPYYHFAFNVPANRLNEALAWIRPKVNLLPIDGSTLIADFGSWNAKSFYFFDNNGSILEFIARFDLPNQSDKPFDSTSILAVSEIGVVVDDVPGYSNEMLAEYDLEIFSKQAKRDDFTVLGDDNGLFIIVNDEKRWFPTDIKAKAFPLKVVFRNNGKINEFEAKTGVNAFMPSLR